MVKSKKFTMAFKNRGHVALVPIPSDAYVPDIRGIVNPFENGKIISMFIYYFKHNYR